MFLNILVKDQIFNICSVFARIEATNNPLIFNELWDCFISLTMIGLNENFASLLDNYALALDHLKVDPKFPRFVRKEARDLRSKSRSD